MMHAQRAVIIPPPEVVVDRAARRQIFRQLRPLTARAEDIHNPIDHRSLVHGSLVAAALGRRDQWPNERPFFVGHVAWIAKLASVVATTVLVRPHAATPCESGSLKGITTNSEDSTCSQMDT